MRGHFNDHGLMVLERVSLLCIHVGTGLKSQPKEEIEDLHPHGRTQ
jgi:hypothetical protein